MPESSITVHLFNLARQAEETVAQSRAQLFWVPVVGCGALGAILLAVLPLAAGLGNPLFWWLAGVLGAVGGAQYGYFLAQKLLAPFERDFATLRRQVRANLLERGLLQLALEHNPFDRLPCLGEALPVLQRPGDSPEGGPMRERLRRLVANYTACCREAGLPPPLDSRFLSLGGLGLWRGWGWAALALGGPLLVYAINTRAHSELASVFGLLAIGLAALIRQRTKQRSDNVNQLVTGLLPAAVELELVALLKPGVSQARVLTGVETPVPDEPLRVVVPEIQHS